MHTLVGALVAPAALIPTGTALAVPMPDPIARVPLVGLLPRWAWDINARPLPTASPSDSDPQADVEAALRFVVRQLTDEGETIDSVAGYRLDDPLLVAVVAELTPRDHGGLRTSIVLAFTVEVTPNGDGTYATKMAADGR